ncbi:MAG: YbaB/EbfC family nucleoid-associated protein [Bacteroidia bacterium]|jgi:DNA-binding protein YbaB|nr:YbaB/EbfC family nucleoid-associated protein [Bacteroidia bacterium]MCO5252951.1 YbaB/EbfC family nucleoid-associated protein [Bacteroidota bacterium]MCZ2131224.1 YbaB/EbfC family nucleoid-associated protein [Bacteroidia bacterium]
MFGNISKMLELKKQAEEMKAKLADIRVVKENLGIKVVLTGLNKVESITFSDDFFADKSKQEIEEMLSLVINAAQEELNNQLKTQFAGIAGGLGL